MRLQDRLPFFTDAEVDSEQRSPVCVKLPRVEQYIFQMVLMDIGLGEWGINKVIRVVRSSALFEEEFLFFDKTDYPA